MLENEKDKFYTVEVWSSKDHPNDQNNKFIKNIVLPHKYITKGQSYCEKWNYGYGHNNTCLFKICIEYYDNTKEEKFLCKSCLRRKISKLNGEYIGIIEKWDILD